MTAATATRPVARQPQAPAGPGAAIGVLTLTLVLGVAGVFGPDLVASDVSMSMSMGMTHYMQLLAVHQPRNLIVFMAVPVVLAETLAITELAILFGRDATPRWVRGISRAAGLVAGPVMLAILLHLLVNAVVPLTLTGGWRGAADLVAVLFYLSGTLPLVGLTLVELGVVGTDAATSLRWHATFIAVFLVVAHVAMIFGMLDPALLGFHMVHQH